MNRTLTTNKKSPKGAPSAPSSTSLRQRLEPFSMEDLTATVEGWTHTSPMVRRSMWIDEAVCARADPEEFFIGQRGGYRPTLYRELRERYCNDCPVRMECLGSALLEDYVDMPEPIHPSDHHMQPIGKSFWFRGGLTAKERHQLAGELGLVV